MKGRLELGSCRRIVIKVGSSSLTYGTGLINLRQIEQLVRVISDLKNSGKEIILVSSGAQAVGVGKLGLSIKPKDMPSRQALAAIGQCELMHIYDKLFLEYSHLVAQVLLTKDVVEEEKTRENTINTMEKLLHFGCIPVLNENDTVSYDEIEFGDNDTLSAIVAGLIRAELLIILTDIDGLYDSDPKTCKNAKRIPEVTEITPDILELGKGSGSNLGTGGMATKLAAAQIAKDVGCKTVIISGQNADNLYAVFDGKDIGTFFP